MSVKIRPYRRGGWEVDILVELPNGTRKRERRRAPVTSRTAALRWGQARERGLLLRSPMKPRKAAPTLAEFAPRFIEGYAVANRQKPSGVAAKQTILDVHLIPHLGRQKLDRITNEDVQHLKGRLKKKSPKTVNNVLTVLSRLLKVAVEWDVLECLPCTIRLLPVSNGEARFLDFHEYEALVRAANANDPRAYLIVLLGGEAGLRCGEMMALEWTDVDFARKRLRVERSEWKGQVTVPKGGRARVVPMTTRLAHALKQHRHLGSPRVLCQADGTPVTQKIVQVLARGSGRLANHPERKRGVHILRHTFCSHLAMRGAAAKAIQALAGHQDLTTTLRYMHLSRGAAEAAIELLEAPAPNWARGDGVETEGVLKVNPLG